MVELENSSNGTAQQGDPWLSSADMSVWVNTAIASWNQGNWWPRKITLDDGSVVMDDGTILSPSNYMLYLGQLMINKKSSDIYFTYGEEPALRIYWEIYRVTSAPKLQDSTLEAMSSVLMSKEDEDFYDRELSCDIGYSIHGRRFRINISRQRWHKMIVARLLEEKVPTIDSLWLPQILKALTKKTSWIIFLAWPTWSWKSTTLAAMIEEINMTRSSHIITVEDPIEYIFEPKKALFEQKQLGKDVTSFASAMKYAMRQRPDVILFWETRDPESLRYAVMLAETWHLVLTTIHSRSAEQTVNKIISMFPVDEQPTIKNQLWENMAAIIIQKLLKTSDGKWMIPAHEVLLNNSAVENTIRENKLNQLKNVMYTYRSAWMLLLEDDLVRLVMEGKISVDQAMFYANDKDSLKRELEWKARETH